jgi:predicted AAA+ superfamily ATPase
LRAVFDRLTGERTMLNGDFADDQALLVPERAALQRLAGHLDYLFIDEAQNVPEIGRVLKLLHDEFPRLRFFSAPISQRVNGKALPSSGKPAVSSRAGVAALH